eukprot:scaffold501_cov105-Isochrysis_galbana.AAC.9
MLGVSRRRKDGKRSQRSHTRAGGGVHKEGSHRYAADRGKRRGELGSSWSGGSRVTRAVAGLAGGGVVALGQPQAHHGGGGHILVVLRAAAHGRHGKNRGGSTGDGQVAVGLHRQRRTVRAGGGHADHLGHAGRGQDGAACGPCAAALWARESAAARWPAEPGTTGAAADAAAGAASCPTFAAALTLHATCHVEAPGTSGLPWSEA